MAQRVGHVMHAAVLDQLAVTETPPEPDNPLLEGNKQEPLPRSAAGALQRRELPPAFGRPPTPTDALEVTPTSQFVGTMLGIEEDVATTCPLLCRSKHRRAARNNFPPS